MTLSENKLIAPVWNRLRTKVGKRFTRFVGVAAALLAANEIMLPTTDGVFHLSATPAALLAWFAGAIVSYVLSRWAWERKGRPDVLRETIPFWVISAMVIVVLTLANKFAYHSASWMGLAPHGVKHVLWVDFIWLCANFVTFVLRFVIFHYVLFAENSPLSAARAAATAEGSGPDLHGKMPRPEATQVTGSAEASPAGAPAGSAGAAGSAAANGSAGAGAGAAAQAAPAKASRAARPAVPESVGDLAD
jgi:putative flippase GtrA